MFSEIGKRASTLTIGKRAINKPFVNAVNLKKLG